VYRQLLVPLDGSTHSEIGLPFALSIAARCGATVHAVLVHEPEAYSEFAGASFEDYDQEGKSREEAYLAGVRKKFGGLFGAKLETHHLEGVVEETLAAEVSQREIDLVVMNAHGWGYTSRAVLGSVSDYLIRHLQVPLLLMHSPAVGGQLERPITFRRILVPLDGSLLAAAALDPAQDLGSLFASEYRLVRVVSPSGILGGLLGSEPSAENPQVLEQARQEARKYLEPIAARLRDERKTASVQVLVHRKVAAAILHEAVAAECDLIAVSTHGRGGLSRLLVGSVADKLVRGADVPVLVYHPAFD
jgi:nucleotide-binding universal stress UspA family protein